MAVAESEAPLRQRESRRRRGVRSAAAAAAEEAVARGERVVRTMVERVGFADAHFDTIGSGEHCPAGDHRTW